MPTNSRIALPRLRVAASVASRTTRWGPWLATLGALAAALTLPGASAAAQGAGGAWSFASDPALSPPRIDARGATSATGATGTVHTVSSGVGEYLFMAPISDYALHTPFAGMPGPLILEADGDPVWQDPVGRWRKSGGRYRREVAMDFHAASYQGKPVLVWWQGFVTRHGLGAGEFKIANQHYQTIATVRAPRGFQTGFHAFAFGPDGTAYFLGARIVPIDLRCCGGPAHGAIYDQVLIQEDVSTGQIVWRWDPLRHIPLREAYPAPPAGRPWDPYHINSIALGPGGNVIVSARNTWAAYWIHRTARSPVGRIFGTLGGKRSSFALGPGARFAWQHDVQALPGGRVSVFADEAAPAVAKQSRGLVIALDWARRTARVVRQYLLPPRATVKLAGSQGSVQVLPDGNVLVGWGQLPYVTEYNPSGRLVYMATLPGRDESYRVFRQPWVGLPLGRPRAVARLGGAGAAATVSASWNGATRVASWQLLAGASPTGLRPSGTPVPRQGFETTIATTSRGPYYAVRALDASGTVLGSSPAVSASG